jgi:hypothetical protein
MKSEMCAADTFEHIRFIIITTSRFTNFITGCEGIINSTADQCILGSDLSFISLEAYDKKKCCTELISLHEFFTMETLSSSVS